MGLRRLRYMVFGSNAAAGSGSSGTAPVNTVAPVVSGSAVQGNVLSTTNGTWTGTATITFTYQWRQDATSNIVGQTSNTYTTQAGDVGHTIDCMVTGTNSVGNASADSNSVGPITSAGGGGHAFGLLIALTQ